MSVFSFYPIRRTGKKIKVKVFGLGYLGLVAELVTKTILTALHGCGLLHKVLQQLRYHMCHITLATKVRPGILQSVWFFFFNLMSRIP